MDTFGQNMLIQLKRSVAVLERSRELQPLFAEVAHAYQAEVGFRLFTITAINQSFPKPVRRLWSSHPEVYPIGGDKELASDDWTEKVMGSRQLMVCNTSVDIATTYPDHDVIDSLGCASGMNLPIVLAEEVLGTINIFNAAGWFDEERIDRAHAMLALVYTPMLLTRIFGTA